MKDAATRLFDQELSFFGHSSLLRDAWWRKCSVNFPGLPNVIPPRLHIACFIGLESWARKILHEGRLFTETTQDTIAEEGSGGWLAMDYAAEGAAEDLVKLLLNDELNSKHSLNQLEAALRRAVLTERDKAARLPLSLGADANATDIEGKPLSLHAAAFKNRAIEKLLAECGARCYVQTPHEQSRVGHDEHALFENGQNRRPPKRIVSVLTREEQFPPWHGVPRMLLSWVGSGRDRHVEPRDVQSPPQLECVAIRDGETLPESLFRWDGRTPPIMFMDLAEIILIESRTDYSIDKLENGFHESPAW